MVIKDLRNCSHCEHNKSGGGIPLMQLIFMKMFFLIHLVAIGYLIMKSVNSTLKIVRTVTLRMMEMVMVLMT